jgi:acyl-coenzyme A thioesterase PaaI-like protein
MSTTEMEPAIERPGTALTPAAAARVRVSSSDRAPQSARHEKPEGTLQRWYDSLEAFLSKLSMRDNFWNSILSLIWLPLAAFSGIRMKELDASTFAARAVLPFRRFNRNWYRAMAGGALLANSEIAGGSYVFGICGAEYTVVCKNLNYTFLRPCFGPAVYRMAPREDLKHLLGTGQEFNITIDMEITQQASRRGERDKRVGRCEATFHVTPKAHHKRKAQQRGARR